MGDSKIIRDYDDISEVTRTISAGLALGISVPVLVVRLALTIPSYLLYMRTEDSRFEKIACFNFTDDIDRKKPVKAMLGRTVEDFKMFRHYIDPLVILAGYFIFGLVTAPIAFLFNILSELQDIKLNKNNIVKPVVEIMTALLKGVYVGVVYPFENLRAAYFDVIKDEHFLYGDENQISVYLRSNMTYHNRHHMRTNFDRLFELLKEGSSEKRQYDAISEITRIISSLIAIIIAVLMLLVKPLFALCTDNFRFSHHFNMKGMFKQLMHNALVDFYNLRNYIDPAIILSGYFVFGLASVVGVPLAMTCRVLYETVRVPNLQTFLSLLVAIPVSIIYGITQPYRNVKNAYINVVKEAHEKHEDLEGRLSQPRYQNRRREATNFSLIFQDMTNILKDAAHVVVPDEH